MDYGFALGSSVLVEKDRTIPIQILRSGDSILCFISGKLFPALVDMCYQHFIRKVKLIKTETQSLRGGVNQSVYQYFKYTGLQDLNAGDILVKRNGEPERIKEIKVCEISMPVYVLQTYPELPFIVNNFVVGSPGINGGQDG